MKRMQLIVTPSHGLIDPDNIYESIEWDDITDKLSTNDEVDALISFGIKTGNIKDFDFKLMDCLILTFNYKLLSEIKSYFSKFANFIIEGNNDTDYNIIIPLFKEIKCRFTFNTIGDILDSKLDGKVTLKTYLEYPQKEDFYSELNKGKLFNSLNFIKYEYKKKLNHVIPIGFDLNRREYLFYSKSKNSFVGINFDRMNRNSLKVLCSQNDYWELNYPSTDPKANIDWENACDHLRDMCDRKGKVDISNGKKNGIWEDRGRLVINLGDKLLVDGEEMDIYDFRGEHFYDYDHKIPWNGESISADEVIEMETYFDLFNFKTEKDKIIVMGTLIPAFLTGILNWRPYLHIGGVNGSGKSTVANKMLRPLFNVFKNKVALNATSAAGIQQEYKNRANVLLFDEFKSTGEHGRGKIDSILELARAAASGKDGVIIKGTSGGKANKISLDCFFITNATMFPAKDIQDKDRFNIVELERLNNEDSNIESKLLNFFNPKLGQKIMKRAAKVHKEFLKSASVLEDCFREIHPDVNSRNARKMMLPTSGYWHLRNDNLITKTEAIELIRSIDFTTETQKTEEELDCFADTLEKFMDHPINIKGNDSTIRGWLHKISLDVDDNVSIDTSSIIDTLKSKGILYKKGYLWFKINNQSLYNIFSHYGYESHRPIISRIEGYVQGKAINVDGKTQRYDGIPYLIEKENWRDRVESDSDYVFTDHSIDFS